MQVRKVLRRRIRESQPGFNVAADVTAVVAGNVGKRGGVTSVSSRQRITQRTGERKDGT